jgi:hypothetical protein
MNLRPFHLLLIPLLVGVFLVSRSIQAQPMPLPRDEAGDTVELLTDGGFEADTDGDNLPDQWKGKKTHLVKKDKLKCNKNGKIFANSGNCAFMIRGNPDGSKGRLQQTIADTSAIVDGSILTLSAYANLVQARPLALIGRAKIKLSNNEKIQLMLTVPGQVSPGYNQLTDSISVSIPDGVTVRKAVVAFGYASGLIDESSSKLFVDDVSLTVTTTEVPAFQLTAIDGGEFDRMGCFLLCRHPSGQQDDHD